MVEMRYLTDKQKAKQIKLEKRLLDLVTEVLSKVNPNVAPVQRRMDSLLLIGMMNWVELWYKQSGKVSPAEFYKMVAQLFLNGYLASGKVAVRKTVRS